MTVIDSVSFPGRMRSEWIVALGWLAFFLIWTLFTYGWGQGDVPIQSAAVIGGITTLVASVLGYGVWKLTKFVRWHGELRPALVGLHVVTAILFAACWMVSTIAMEIVWDGGNLMDMSFSTRTVYWRMFMGTWLYVLFAGVSYAVRISIQLRAQRQKTADAERLAATARLDAMRSQLHPHFLFNALHTAGSLIETDPIRASDAIEMLGDLLRYAIRDRNTQMVSLEEEWRFVEDYVALQRIRFGDRVHVSMHMDPGARGIRVPAFVIQPLVENAFIHGMADQEEGGSIRIEVESNEEELCIAIVDDGSGMAAGHDSASGSGLKNLRHRLEMLYGIDAVLTIRNRQDRGVSARILIPVHPQEEDDEIKS